MSNEMALSEQELINVLQSSLYPSAALDSVKMVLGYCKAANLDPMQKPVHIVPIWDSKTKQMRDVVMPGIGLYRIQASRSGSYAGVTDSEFGQDVVTQIDGVQITYPISCKVTVKRLLDNGTIAEFTATERWLENYATRGKDSKAPNAMWAKRPYAQLAKCAEAQALRKAFPEIGSALTAEEMEGKTLYENTIESTVKEVKYITTEQLNEVSELIFNTGTDLNKVLKSRKVEGLANFQQHDFDIVMEKLKLKSVTVQEEVQNDNP